MKKIPYILAALILLFVSSVLAVDVFLGKMSEISWGDDGSGNKVASFTTFVPWEDSNQVYSVLMWLMNTATNSEGKVEDSSNVATNHGILDGTDPDWIARDGPMGAYYDFKNENTDYIHWNLSQDIYTMDKGLIAVWVMPEFDDDNIQTIWRFARFADGTLTYFYYLDDFGGGDDHITAGNAADGAAKWIWQSAVDYTDRLVGKPKMRWLWCDGVAMHFGIDDDDITSSGTYLNATATNKFVKAIAADAVADVDNFTLGATRANSAVSNPYRGWMSRPVLYTNETEVSLAWVAQELWRHSATNFGYSTWEYDEWTDLRTNLWMSLNMLFGQQAYFANTADTDFSPSVAGGAANPTFVSATNGYSFDGGDYFVFPAAHATSVKSALGSFSARVKADTLPGPTTNMYIFSNYQSATNRVFLSLYNNAGDYYWQLTSQLTNGAVHTANTSALADPTSNRWYSVGYTISNYTAYVYQNGSAGAAGTYMGAANWASASVGALGTTPSWDGSMKKMKWLDRPLSAAQMSELQNAVAAEK